MQGCFGMFTIRSGKCCRCFRGPQTSFFKLLACWWSDLLGNERVKETLLKWLSPSTASLQWILLIGFALSLSLSLSLSLYIYIYIYIKECRTTNFGPASIVILSFHIVLGCKDGLVSFLPLDIVLATKRLSFFRFLLSQCNPLFTPFKWPAIQAFACFLVILYTMGDSLALL